MVGLISTTHCIRLRLGLLIWLKGNLLVVHMSHQYIIRSLQFLVIWLLSLKCLALRLRLLMIRIMYMVCYGPILVVYMTSLRNRVEFLAMKSSLSLCFLPPLFQKFSKQISCNAEIEKGGNKKDDYDSKIIVLNFLLQCIFKKIDGTLHKH